MLFSVSLLTAGLLFILHTEAKLIFEKEIHANDFSIQNLPITSSNSSHAILILPYSLWGCFWRATRFFTTNPIKRASLSLPSEPGLGLWLPLIIEMCQRGLWANSEPRSQEASSSYSRLPGLLLPLCEESQHENDSDLRSGPWPQTSKGGHSRS